MAEVKERGPVGSHSVKKHKSPLGWLPWLALALLALLALLAWLLISNVSDENDREGVDLGDDEVAAGAANADAGGVDCPSAADASKQLFQSIDEIVGCRIDARVTVADVADDNTFAVTDGSNDVLVIDGSKGEVLETGQKIRMTGTVRNFEFDEIKDELKLEKSKAAYSKYEGRNVVVADSTTPA